MHWLKVINWIGIFALAVGSLISLIHGDFLLTLFGISLVSILITSQIPLTGKLAVPLNHLHGVRMIQRGAGVVGMVGCWVLAGLGGWEFVPAGMVLTVAMIGVLIKKFIEIKRRRSIASIESGSVVTVSDTDSKQLPQLPRSSQLPPPPQVSLAPEPPQYTSTVKIIQDSSDPNPNNLTIQTPKTIPV